MTVTAKICGLSDADSISASVDNGAYLIGFIFYPPSPRYVSPEQAMLLSQNIPSEVGKVAVLVNPIDHELEQLFNTFKPDYLQLHGHETPERVRDMRARFSTKIIKAIPIGSNEDLATIDAYNEAADMLLLDAKPFSTKALPGGNGLSFDWTLLKNQDIKLPWLLSGGLNKANLKKAVKSTDAIMVDVSSGVETAPGIKSPGLIREFLQAVNRL